MNKVEASSLKGKIAAVTGASSGIGKAIVLGLIKEGVTVCMVGRDSDKLKAVADSTSKPEDLFLCRADIGIDKDIENIIKDIQGRFGGIDILIHSAGTILLGDTEEASIEDFDFQYRINVRAAYLLTQKFLPALKDRSGQIVFLNSSVGLHAKAGVGQYAATKHALKAVADSLRDEVNADGIRVLSVYSGRTATPMQEQVHQMDKRAYNPERLMQPEDVAAVIVNALSLPRSAEMTDLSVRPMQK